MLSSFRRRLAQHCKWLCRHVPRYSVLDPLVSDRLRIADTRFPAMNLPFIGASIYGAALPSSRQTSAMYPARPGAITLQDLKLQRPLPDALFCPQQAPQQHIPMGH